MSELTDTIIAVTSVIVAVTAIITVNFQRKKPKPKGRPGLESNLKRFSFQALRPRFPRSRRGRTILAIVVSAIILIGVLGYLARPNQSVQQTINQPIQITPLCGNLVISPNTPLPSAGLAGVVRFQCSGSASNPFCGRWSSGLDCAFYAGDSSGGGSGLATPAFNLPSGYIHIWQKGSAVYPATLTEEQDCAQFDDPAHWLTSGTPYRVGNISGVYCAHLVGASVSPPIFTITWND